MKGRENPQAGELDAQNHEKGNPQSRVESLRDRATQTPGGECKRAEEIQDASRCRSSEPIKERRKEGQIIRQQEVKNS
jgi:hypothetical protein